ncbi:GYDIA family GHMP kinase [Psychroflexus aestuariivivens]|uniref:GYDIA family GHMP kinase n=1 Tax=Psychroflexus aestuariivivens TaxID=1795040 RepID=UPI000FDB8C6A|nr:GYDIA family GHMP kinase [Psychroflexus aestuariivivens]
MPKQRFYSHGKLLITSEYLVLDGAKALALPCKFGQDFTVQPKPGNFSTWTSFDEHEKIWFSSEFDLNLVLNSNQTPKNEFESRLFQIFSVLAEMKPKLFSKQYDFRTKLEFPKNWGLGTSSTLINNLADWAAVNPYELLAKTFGGSGYDIACAGSNSALTFQLKNKIAFVQNVEFPEILKPYIYFVHLNQKQNSREAIQNYRRLKLGNVSDFISKVNSITNEISICQEVSRFQNLVLKHESLLSEVLQIETVQQRLFSDFSGVVKSLGAWGGDFLMAVSEHNPEEYFRNKGFSTILDYETMVL